MVGDRRVRVCVERDRWFGEDQIAGTELKRQTKLAAGRTRVRGQGCFLSCFRKMIHGSIVETALCIRRATARRMLVGWYDSEC